jgi:hypothetical protein
LTDRYFPDAAYVLCLCVRARDAALYPNPGEGRDTSMRCDELFTVRDFGQTRDEAKRGIKKGNCVPEHVEVTWLEVEAGMVVVLLL